MGSSIIRSLDLDRGTNCLIIHYAGLFAFASLRFVELDQILNILLATEEDWATFVDLSRLDVKDPLCPRSGETSGLGGHVSDLLVTFLSRKVLTCSVR